MNLKDSVRDVPDFPKKGIIFKDITTLLKNPEAMQYAIDELYSKCVGLGINKVVGIESRGFILGGAVASKLGVGFVPIRKPGKLPAAVVKETYTLEYGTDTIEIHKDAISPGDKVLLHDDLLATGGTAKAACNLIEKLGGEIVQLSFIIELSFLKGREHFQGYDVRSLISYDSE